MISAEDSFVPEVRKDVVLVRATVEVHLWFVSQSGLILYEMEIEAT